MTKDNVLIVEFIDRATECIVDDLEIDSGSVDAILKKIDQPRDELLRRGAIEIDANNLRKLKEYFPHRLDLPSVLSVRLRRRRPIDDLPYKVHTNRELSMMLAGAKPLTAFSERVQDSNEESFIPEALFLPYVAAGKFVRREEKLPMANGKQDRLVLFATSAEAWRIEAYILLKQTALKCGWSEGFERLEGSLLGYLDWQNDAYIERVFSAFPSK